MQAVVTRPQSQRETLLLSENGFYVAPVIMHRDKWNNKLLIKDAIVAMILSLLLFLTPGETLG